MSAVIGTSAQHCSSSLITERDMTGLVTHNATEEEALPRDIQHDGSHDHTQSLSERIHHLRRRFEGFAVKKPDPTVTRELHHGWMLPVLVELDGWLWQRWNYWADCYCSAGALPPAPIPRIQFLMMPHQGTRKMLEASLNCIPNHGSWQTWGGWQFVNYFFDWLLFAFGHKGQVEPPQEPAGCSGASNRLYQVFNLDAMLLWPYDYFGDILGENAYGKRQGFYATPHCVCEMMTRMVFEEGKDSRRETMMDPCVGTGRFPLFASNYTLRLYGMDIDLTLCKATLINGYMYAPWLVRPIPWLDPDLAQIGQVDGEAMPHSHTDAGRSATPQSDSTAQVAGEVTISTNSATASSPSLAAELSDSMVAAAPPHAQGYLLDTEHDAPAQTSVAPILKRRKKQHPVSEEQGSLF